MLMRQIPLALVLVAVVLVGCTPGPVDTEPANTAVNTPTATEPGPTVAVPEGYEMDGLTLKPKSEERPIRPLPELFESLKAEAWEERLAAVEDLGKSGDTSEAVIEALVDMYNDTHGQVYFAASDTLRRIGSKAVPKVIEGLEFEGENARFAAAYTLKGINPPPVEALEPLRDALDDEGVYVRMYAVQALAHLGAVAEPAIPALEDVAANEDENPETRAFAAKAIELIQEKMAEQEPNPSAP